VQPWPDALGTAVLDAIEAAVAPGSAAPTVQLSGLIRAAGPSVSASLFDRALALASHDTVRAVMTRIAHDFDVFAHQIRLRQRLHQEIVR
jgi:energy-converting hydrogenase Eha subunit E